MKNLFVLPGGGNPDTDPVYQNVYEVIEGQAVKYGYRNVYTDFRWPCHVEDAGSYDQKPALTLQEALKSAVNTIKALPDEPYSLLARSFGCFVALKISVCPDMLTYKLPEKIILWGPDP